MVAIDWLALSNAFLYHSPNVSHIQNLNKQFSALLMNAIWHENIWFRFTI